MGASSVFSLVHWFAAFMQGGGIFMWVILFLWVLGMAICLERFSKLCYQYDVDGPSFMNEIQRHILSNDIQGAIRISSGTTAMLPRVLKSGLKRFASSPEQVQNAIDATALEVIPKVELRLSHLSAVANISTLIGLLGTIQGLIQSFSAVASVDPAQKAELLTKGVAVALNTTALGLFSATTILIFHTLLRTKAEKIISEIDEYSVKLLDLIGTKQVQVTEEEKTSSQGA